MANIVVAFSKPEDAKNIKNILMKNGFQVIAVCTSGAQALNSVDGLNKGIVISGYRFADMMFDELHDCLPSGFAMLMISSPTRWGSQMPRSVVCLPIPLKVNDLVNTLEMMLQAQSRRKRNQKQKPRQRSEEEQSIIEQAKSILMERNNMTELEAHRYIQKCSMDSGTNFVETAQMVMSLINI